MSFVEFEHKVLPRILLPLMGGLLLLAAFGRTNVQADERHTFVISDSEGYGITECLTSGSSCGRVVADAWCEAHGLGAALAFGPADDVTGAIATNRATTTVAAAQLKPGSVVVTCDN
jgi:hypothetical protein